MIAQPLELEREPETAALESPRAEFEALLAAESDGLIELIHGEIVEKKPSYIHSYINQYVGVLHHPILTR